MIRNGDAGPGRAGTGLFYLIFLELVNGVTLLWLVCMLDTGSDENMSAISARVTIDVTERELRKENGCSPRQYRTGSETLLQATNPPCDRPQLQLVLSKGLCSGNVACRRRAQLGPQTNAGCARRMLSADTKLQQVFVDLPLESCVTAVNRQQDQPSKVSMKRCSFASILTIGSRR